MVVTLQLRQIDVQPGQCLILREINWTEFEAILEELGEHRGARVAYYQGVLEIRMPLPENEKAKILIGEFVKILLDELEIDWEPYGSTTFKRQEMVAGLEPDDCFYIQNAARMIGVVNRVEPSTIFIRRPQALVSLPLSCGFPFFFATPSHIRRIIELAKQGDTDAIAHLLNHSLMFNHSTIPKHQIFNQLLSDESAVECNLVYEHLLHLIGH